MKKYQVQQYFEHKGKAYWELIESDINTLKEAKQIEEAIGGRTRIIEYETKVTIRVIEVNQK